MNLRTALIAAALVFPSAALAQPASKRFAIPGHGTLLLSVPADWRVADKSSPNPPAVALSILPATGDSFNLQVTAVWLEPAKMAGITPEVIKERTQAASKKLLEQSVEKEAPLAELRGKEMLGYYFSLTDRKSQNKAGDYKYIAQGTGTVGEAVIIYVTFLHRDPATPAKNQALQMIAEAAYVKDASK